MTDAIIIFGSAVSGWSAPDHINDIDVAFVGDAPTPDDETIVRGWAKERGLPDGLGIHAHSIKPWAGRIVLPTVPGGSRAFVVLKGMVEVGWREHGDLPALVRAHGHDAAALRAALESGARFQLVSPEGQPEQDWEGYTQGFRALTNARRRAPAWASAGPVAAFLDELMRRMPALAPRHEIVRALRGGSPAGAGAATLIARVTARGLEAIHGNAVVPWILNLCPHPIRLRLDPSSAAEPLPTDVVLKPAPTPARLDQRIDLTNATILGAPVALSAMGEPPDMPPALWRIVSMPLAQILRGRDGIVCPATGPADEPVRDAAGQVYAVRRFTSF